MIRRYVSFSLAAGRYCLPVENVTQVIRPENVHNVPRSPEFVEGVINLHGDIIPVIDLRKRVGLSGPSALSGADPRRRRIVIVRRGQRSYGLDVDEVHEILEVEPSGILEGAAGVAEELAPFVSATAQRGESTVPCLDLAAILQESRTAGQLP